MTLIGDGEGPNGDNDRFQGTLPGAALPAGQTVHYWVQATGVDGRILFDSNNGANYTPVPRALLGQLGRGIWARTTSQGGVGFFENGKLFNADLSTTVGCVEDGADDYWIQAIQVYVPGLTDQGYTGNLACRRFVAHPRPALDQPAARGWGPIALACKTGLGNNDVCDLQLTEFPRGRQLLSRTATSRSGTTSYKVRFSVDDGATWYWVGSIDGDGGGQNLNVYYQPHPAPTPPTTPPPAPRREATAAEPELAGHR